MNGDNGAVTVESVALQPDGKILVGGAFTEFNGSEHHSIARLNPDGSIDPTFQTGSGINGVEGFAGTVRTIAIQADGKIIVAGYFADYDSETRNSIARINATGSIDESFNPNSSPAFVGQILTLELQLDGKIIVGGLFSGLGGSLSENLVRLHPDGSIDQNFAIGTGVDGYGVEDIAIQSDGKILIAGQFSEVNGEPHFTIARLHPNGTIDGSFNLDTDFNWYASRKIAVQNDGKIILGCWLTTYFNGPTMVVGVVRLNPDGAIDFSFNPGTGINGGWIADVQIHSDGRVIVAGTFTEFDGVPRSCIARLNGTTVGISEDVDSRLFIFPNPSNGLFHLNKGANIEFVVYDSSGREIKRGFSRTIDLSGHSDGVYFLHGNEKGEFRSTKIVLSGR